MNIAKICIVSGGILSLFMAFFHSRFYKLFEWQKDFEKISFRNQKIFYTIHIALFLLFVVFAFISLAYTTELSQCNGLAGGIVLAYALFWLWRTVWQIIYFRPPKSSKHGRLLFLHYFLIIIFAMLFIVYVVPFILKILR